MTTQLENEREVLELLRGSRARIESELSKVIIGQKDVIEQLLISLFAGGHCLITGAPGLAKTLLVNSIAEVFALSFQRIQFTPDLMPADITGTEILEEDHETGRRKMVFVKGPVFANVLLADEINRTPPKTQAALLEAMQEHQVTAAGKRYQLDEPFFVLATQNPIEMEGTYPLPEAQLDRFMFNVIIDYLPEDDEVAVVHRLRLASRIRLKRSLPASRRCSFRRLSVPFPSRKTLCATPSDWRVRLDPVVRRCLRLSGNGSVGVPDCERLSTWCSVGRLAHYSTAAHTFPLTISTTWRDR